MNRTYRLAASLLIALTLAFTALADGPIRVYVGTYTGPKSKGIYTFDFDPTTGKATEPRVAAQVTSPSFIAIHPSKKYLYSVTEAGKVGTVTAFAINADGGLTKLNEQTSGGRDPCFVATDPSGKTVMLANYTSGGFESLPVKDDGSLGEPAAFIQDEGKGSDPARQEGPHAHSINPSPDGHFAFGCDLGLDAVIRFKLDAAAGRIAVDDRTTIAPGSGPRHLVFSPDAKSAYVVSEMGSSVTAFHYNLETGALTDAQSASTLPPDFHGQSTCAEVQIHPNGKFVYASNRGDDSIAVLKVDAATGRLSPVSYSKTGGKTPRNFRIDPTGTWLFAANQNSDTIKVFKIDLETGALTPTETTIAIGSPVCVKFVEVGK